MRGKGNLSVLMDSNQKGFLPQQFEANNLFLVYAQNQLQATGNAQNLKSSSMRLRFMSCIRV